MFNRNCDFSSSNTHGAAQYKQNHVLKYANKWEVNTKEQHLRPKHIEGAF